jgi:hypothetical protein
MLWLRTALILGAFGRKAPDAKNGYRQFVEALLKSAYERLEKAPVASTVCGRSACVRAVVKRYLGEQRAE